jgi:hypothetical protein
VPLRFHARSSRHKTENAVAFRFRQRHGQGVPLAEPPTEARRRIKQFLEMSG